MQKIYLLLSFVVISLFCGCDKEAKINSEKIQILSQKIVQLEQSQSKQMVVIQSELNSLAPMLDKINNTYFEKNRDDALFFHTNTLYLLVTVGKQIEAQLQTADAEREVQSSLTYSYHTNQLSTLYLCTAQIEDAMNSQESRIENNINAETRRAGGVLSDVLQKQVELSSARDADEVARQKEMDAQVIQIQRDLATIKARLETTNLPALKP
jgi:hypothetical protein